MPRKHLQPRFGGAVNIWWQRFRADFLIGLVANFTEKARASARLAGGALALNRVELALAEAERLRRNLEELVVEKEVDALLERILSVRGELDRAVAGVSAHVRKLFFLADVDVEVVLFVR